MKSSSWHSVARCAASLAGLWLICVAQPARAQVDMNGPWRAETLSGFGLYDFSCDLNFTQTGTSLTISGTCGVIDAVSLSGTIDPNTGSFSGNGSAGTECPSLQITLGSASLDNRTFSAGFFCSGGPSGGFQGLLNGARCGNGVVDTISGEQCDIAIDQCCSGVFFSCQFAPPGASCSDNNQCTDDMCDGAGTCLHTDRTGPCDDGNQCTDPDECVAGTCTSTALPDGSACNDFDTCTTESCSSGTCAAVTKPDGAACDDGFDCQAGETCLAGVCQVGANVVCSACKRCYEGVGCVPEVNAGHSVENTSASTLRLKKTDLDRTNWTWRSYDAIASTDFGDPTTTTGYELCIFDYFAIDPMTGFRQLLFAASASPGSGWKQTPSGFLYTSSDKTLKIRLKAGDVGKGKILARAKGPAYGITYLPPVDAVETKLRTVEGVTPAISFDAYFSTPITSTATKFKAQTPFP